MPANVPALAQIAIRADDELIQRVKRSAAEVGRSMCEAPRRHEAGALSSPNLGARPIVSADG